MRIDRGALDRHRRAVEGSVAVVARVTPSDLGRPTPCAGWTLADLLAHMVVQHDGFAAAARGETTELADWAPRPVGDDVVAVYRKAADGVVGAFGECAPDAELWLPEVRGGVGVPAPTALGFHLVDYVVHAWDVAASLGVASSFAPDDDVAAHALAVARQVPDGAARTVPGAAFAPALAEDGGGAPAQILRLLGRDPAWAPDGS
ncbi:TIGR03086 family protein [Luteimicrobium album]|uniref:TIGR03086 family protein n=1 Tax=Luteimicrobium album TaxID=1054550 RepID=A0ABQ6I6E5_9MICO|nr:TIGR03086 family metal-binding protein [Luteimicrobium album]GMA26256.1 TIGR03086 family protein [Luteimicrobium album]